MSAAIDSHMQDQMIFKKLKKWGEKKQFNEENKVFIEHVNSYIKKLSSNLIPYNKFKLRS